MKRDSFEDHKGDPTLLDEIDGFVEASIHTTRTQQTALVLGFATSHDPFASSTQPRFLITGPPQSGKSSVMDLMVMLSDNGWVSDSTAPGIRAFFNTEGNHTLGIDEADKTFGQDGQRGQSHPTYRILNDGYRKRATLSYSQNRILTSVSSYGPAWISGIGDCAPPDTRKRAIRISMEEKPSHIEKDDTLDDSVYSTGLAYQEQLHNYILSNHDFLVWFNKTQLTRIHPSMNNRKRQIWGPLFAIAHAAGGRWPSLVMESFLDINESFPAAKPTTNQQILLDTETIITQSGYPKFLYTIDLIENLPQRDLYEQWTEEYLLQALSRALGTTHQVKSKRLNKQNWQGKGRDTAPILKAAKEVRELLDPPQETEPDNELDDELGGPEPDAS
jgi:hypothetical protein